MKKNYHSLPLNPVILIGLLFVLLGCNHDKESNVTFFGGKIKNPKEKYVYFNKGEKVIDSAKINKQNRFSFQLDSIETGLYNFKHGLEFQYLYLEPKDSLLLYLNTWDFDESLIFSGKGSAKNNYLIGLWLQQEKNEKYFKHKYILDEKSFLKEIDNSLQKQLNAYHKLIENEGEEPSQIFDKLAKTAIYFPYYYLKEHYAYNHQKAIKSSNPTKLSADFYAYRDHINLNDASLLNYWAYTSYMYSYLWNMAYEEKAKDPSKNNILLNYMNIVNDKIHIESFKNALLISSLKKSLANDKLSEKEKKILQEYFIKNCSDEKMIAQFQNQYAESNP